MQHLYQLESGMRNRTFYLVIDAVEMENTISEMIESDYSMKDKLTKLSIFTNSVVFGPRFSEPLYGSGS